MSALVTEARRDDVVTLALNRPDRLNSFTVALHEEFAAALARVGSARALIITGNGRAFCAGQDLSERRVPEGAPMPDLGESLSLRYNPMIRAIAALKMPTIAAVNGAAVGAGVGIALACDIAVAAESASFRLPGSKLGLIPDAGSTWTASRTVGLARARAMAMLGEAFTAAEAERVGLIWRCVPDPALLDEAHALALRMGEG
ncbi:MAG: 2-(1,2-epoxy,2-dihydrophenyl)acetyl-CoA isomerase [Rhodospirillales bacterium]|nr:2-(1,2-epoxy,2-dihydrophenyl)acetyl-CoA isomerase [Rhodospirillales bacterium]